MLLVPRGSKAAEDGSASPFRWHDDFIYVLFSTKYFAFIWKYFVHHPVCIFV